MVNKPVSSTIITKKFYRNIIRWIGNYRSKDIWKPNYPITSYYCNWISIKANKSGKYEQGMGI